MSGKTEVEVAEIGFSLPNKEKAEAFKAKLRELGYNVFNPLLTDPEVKKHIELFIAEQNKKKQECVLILCSYNTLQDDTYNEKLIQAHGASFSAIGMYNLAMISPKKLMDLSQKIAKITS